MQVREQAKNCSSVVPDISNLTFFMKLSNSVLSLLEVQSVLRLLTSPANIWYNLLFIHLGVVQILRNQPRGEGGFPNDDASVILK